MPDQDSAYGVGKEPQTQSPMEAPSQSMRDQNVLSATANPTGKCNDSATNQLERDIRSGERWLIGVGIAAVVINTVIALIYWGQLSQMREATKAAKISADAAQKASETADATLKEIQISSTDTHKLAEAAGKQAESLTKLVNAATMSVNVQRQIAKPIVVLHPVTGVYHSEQTKKVWAVVRVQNNGSTDAQSISVAVKLGFRASDPKPTDYKFRASDFKPTIPDTLTPFGPTKQTADTPLIEMAQQITPEEYPAYRGRRFYIWGRIRFKDATQAVLPDVPFCRYATGNVLDAPGGEWPHGGYASPYSECNQAQTTDKN